MNPVVLDMGLNEGRLQGYCRKYWGEEDVFELEVGRLKEEKEALCGEKRGKKHSRSFSPVYIYVLIQHF